MTIRIGISGGGPTVDRLIDHAVRAEADGFTSLWYAGGGGVDPFVVAPLVGRATSRIEVGTSIVQTYPRHPVLMAQEATTVVRAIGDSTRFALGIGVSHRPVIEGTYGLSYDTNARHLREYLTVLGGLLSEGRVRFRGEEYSAAADLADRPDPVLRVLVAALAPKALASAGELAGLLPIARPGVSRHLRVLREAGLVDVQQDAQWRVYSLRPEPLAEIDAWLDPYRALWEQRLDALHAEVARGKKARRSST